MLTSLNVSLHFFNDADFSTYTLLLCFFQESLEKPMEKNPDAYEEGSGSSDESSSEESSEGEEKVKDKAGTSDKPKTDEPSKNVESKPREEAKEQTSETKVSTTPGDEGAVESKGKEPTACPNNMANESCGGLPAKQVGEQVLKKETAKEESAHAPYPTVFEYFMTI